MVAPDSSRALYVASSGVGLCRLEGPARGLVVRFWAEAADGRTEPGRDLTLPAAGFVPVAGRETLVPAKPWGLVAFDPALEPFRFGFQAYDPFEALAGRLDQAAMDGVSTGAALWAAMEAALFSFAFDPGFTSALDQARGSEEWRRFAGLNELYRALVRALAPLGAPSAWSAWLRGEAPDYRLPRRTRSAEKALERLRARKAPVLAAALLKAVPQERLFGAPPLPG